MNQKIVEQNEFIHGDVSPLLDDSYYFLDGMWDPGYYNIGCQCRDQQEYYYSGRTDKHSRRKKEKKKLSTLKLNENFTDNNERDEHKETNKIDKLREEQAQTNALQIL